MSQWVDSDWDKEVWVFVDGFGDVDCSDAGLGLSHELSVLVFLMVTGDRLG